LGEAVPAHGVRFRFRLVRRYSGRGQKVQSLGRGNKSAWGLDAAYRNGRRTDWRLG
jgi:hypothetical protein